MVSVSALGIVFLDLPLNLSNAFLPTVSAHDLQHKCSLVTERLEINRKYDLTVHLSNTALD